MNRKLLLFAFLVILNCASSDLANEDQVNWCIGKINNLIDGAEENDLTDSDFSSDNYRTSAWEILKEKNVIADNQIFMEMYAGGSLDVWLSDRLDFMEKYKNELPSNLQEQKTWGFSPSMKLYKYYLYEDNEYALKHCKIWEEISY